MFLTNLAGVILLFSLIIVMLLVVPLERVRKLLLFGVIFGVFLPLLIIYIMQNVLGLWIHRGVDFFDAAGIPVFFAVAWMPAIIMFAHYMLQYRSPLLRVLLILTVGAGVAAIQFLLMANNMLVFNQWTLLDSFLLAVALHLGLIGILHLMGHLDLRNLTKR